VISGFRSFAFFVFYSFKRQLRSRKMLLSALLLGLLAAVVFLVGLKKSWTPRSFCEEVILKMIVLFFLPVVTLIFGTGALGDDRDEKSLVYLLVRPLFRSGIFLGKLVAVTPLALLFTLGGLWLLHCVAGLSSEYQTDLGTYVPAVFFGSLAYLSLFHFLSAAFRHSTLMAIAYVFFVEVFLGRVPGIVKRVSISFYTSCLVYDSALPSGVELPFRKTFLPVPGAVACDVLVGIACGLAILGAVYFARHEYPAND